MKQVITWTCDSVGAAVYFFIKQFLSAVEGVNGVIFMGGQWQEAVGMEKDGQNKCARSCSGVGDSSGFSTPVDDVRIDLDCPFRFSSSFVQLISC